MTPKQECFVQEYLVDLNATQAVIRAGYSRKGPSRQGNHLLRTPAVAKAIATAKAERASRLAITAERVLAEYARVAFANLADCAKFDADGLALVEMAALSPAQTAAIAEVSENKTTRGATVRFKLHDKLGALNAIARHIGLVVPDKLALTDAEGHDPPPMDAFEIARQIAFALRQGEEAQGGEGGQR